MIVLDASALVAAVHNDEGGQRVRTILKGDGVMMNTANYAEVFQKLVFLGVEVELIRAA